jgi:signal transduction histidine kinase
VSKEKKRLEALQKLTLMDTPPEERFDRICRLASKLLQTPIAYLSLLDDERQFYKAAVGLGDMTETSRADSFCTYTIDEAKTLYVPDATSDDRFRDNPYVKGPPGVRCYLGEPLFSSDGHPVGTFCILDTKPRELELELRSMFGDLASLAERELNLLALLHQQRKLTELTSHLVSSLDPCEIANTLLEVLKGSLPIARAAVAIQEGDSLRVTAALGGEPAGALFSANSPPLRCFTDSPNDSLRIPIEHNAMQLGMLWVESSPALRFTSLEKELISSFVVQAALILENRAILANLFEQSRLVSLGSLAAGVAHELNSPLGAALLSLQSAIRNLDQDKEVRVIKKLTRVNQAISKAATIISGVLQYAGEGPEPSSQSVLDEVLEQTLTLINHEFDTLGISLRVKPAATVRVTLGQNELQTVIHHLLRNAAWAVQQTGATAREIEVCTEFDDRIARLTVVDRGPGVEEASRQRIFDPFFTTRQPGEGVGLGLPVSRKLAEKVGGELLLLPSESGARFQVTLPVDRPSTRL